MNHTVYILQSITDNKRYIGYTAYLDLRLRQHELGLVKSTQKRRPLKLIHTETFLTKKEATEREHFYKTGAGREHLKSSGK